MPHRSKRIKFLAGSPVVHSLSWDDDALVSTFCPRVRRYLDGEFVEPDDSQTTTSFSFPAWRLVKFIRKSRDSTTVLTSEPSSPSSIDDAQAADQDRSDFLEHSFAVIQDLQSSQIQAAPDDTRIDDTTIGQTSFTTTTFSTTTTSSSFATTDDSTLLIPSTAPPAPLPILSGPITDLHHIPSAPRLQSLYPQTVTVNLIAGIIAISPPRTVNLRRRPEIEMEIVELTIGDETRAGFGVSFWLPATSTTTTAAAAAAAARRDPAATARKKTTTGADEDGAIELRAQLAALRAGDVVLLTHVALSEYRGRVYGQSLNRRTTRNRTSVRVLREGGGGGRPMGLPDALEGKWGKTREWADRFVGVEGGRKKREDAGGGDGDEDGDGDGRRRSKRLRGRERERDREVLPPDTQ